MTGRGRMNRPAREAGKPPTSYSINASSTVQAGQFLAKVGPKAAHLHFGALNKTEAGVTLPVAFTDYWISNDEGDTWQHVLRGHPKKGQWIKRTN